MTAAALIARAAEHGFVVAVSDGRPELVPVLAGAILPPKLLADLKEHKPAILAHLTCRECGRAVCDTRHVERLRASSAFCESAKCPFKRS